MTPTQAKDKDRQKSRYTIPNLVTPEPDPQGVFQLNNLFRDINESALLGGSSEGFRGGAGAMGSVKGPCRFPRNIYIWL